MMRWNLDVENLHQELISLLESSVPYPPARFVEEPLQRVVFDRAVSMDISLYDAPQALDSRCGLVFALPRAILGFVHHSVNIELLAGVVASPEVSEDLSPFLHVVPNHLCTGDLSSILHHKRSHVLGTSFVKPKDPNGVLLPALGMMREFAFVNFHGSPHLSKLVLSVRVLEVDVNQMPDPTIDVMDVPVL